MLRKSRTEFQFELFSASFIIKGNIKLICKYSHVALCIPGCVLQYFYSLQKNLNLK